MKDFGLLLKKLRKSKGLNQEELAEILGVRKTTISNYETGYSTPSNVMLRQIADYFEVSAGELLGETPAMREAPFVPDTSFKYIPVYSTLTATEGQGLPLYQLQLPVALMGEGEFFALKIAGDRMDRSALSDGSIAIIRRQAFADDGEIAVVAVGNDPALIGRLYRSGALITLIAESSNPMYRPVVVNAGEQAVKILGKVIKVIQPVL